MYIDSNVWAAIISSSATAAVAIIVVIYQNKKMSRQLRNARVAVMREKWLSEFRNTFVELLAALDNFAYANLGLNKENKKKIEKSINAPIQPTEDFEHIDLANNPDIRTARLNRYRLELMFERSKESNSILLKKIDEYIKLHLETYAEYLFTKQKQNEIKSKKKDLIDLVEIKLSKTWNEVTEL